MADREVCLESEGGERERERERGREAKRGKRAPADASETRTNDFVLWAAKVICSLDMQSQWFSYGLAARARVIPGRASSILLPSLRDFEISFAPLLEGEFSPLNRERGKVGEGERNPLPIDRYFATMPRHGSPSPLPPSLPPLSFACRYYERKQTGNWFDRRFFFYRPVKNRWRIFSHSVDYCADCRAMWKEIANAKLRFPPQWNPCRRWRAGYRRGTRIKNPIQRALSGLFEIRIVRGVRAAYTCTSPRSFLTRFSDLILRPPVSPLPMDIVLLISATIAIPLAL